MKYGPFSKVSTMSFKRVSLLILAIAALCAAAFLLGRYEGRKGAKSEPIIQTDTIYRSRPMSLAGAPKIAERVTASWPMLMIVPVPGDTIREIVPQPVDTSAIILQFVESIQQDTAGIYTAYLSGYKIGEIGPRLDSLHLNIPERIITNTLTVEVEKAKRWSLGIYAGYGMAIANGSPILAPEIGIGVSYNLLSW